MSMLTQSDVEKLRKHHATYVKMVARELTKVRVMRSRMPREYRAAEITVARLSHAYHTVAREFNKIVRISHRHAYMKPLDDLRAVVNNKYLPTCLSVLDLTRDQKIDLGRWILAQSETIRIPHFTLFHCYGYNALSRYESWEAKQQKKYVQSSERSAQTDSKEKTITKSIMDAHVTALKWQSVLLEIEAPTLSVALWYLWPSVSVWYLLAHEEFCNDILETGLCTTPMLVSRWKTYLRSPRIQAVCIAALEMAQDQFGKLGWTKGITG